MPPGDGGDESEERGAFTVKLHATPTKLIGIDPPTIRADRTMADPQHEDRAIVYADPEVPEGSPYPSMITYRFTLDDTSRGELIDEDPQHLEDSVEVRAPWHEEDCTLRVSVEARAKFADGREVTARDTTEIRVVGANPELSLHAYVVEEVEGGPLKSTDSWTTYAPVAGTANADGSTLVLIRPRLKLFGEAYAGGFRIANDMQVLFSGTAFEDVYFEKKDVVEFGPERQEVELWRGTEHSTWHGNVYRKQQGLVLRCKFHLKKKGVESFLTHITGAVRPTHPRYREKLANGVRAEQPLKLKVWPSTVHLTPPHPSRLPTGGEAAYALRFKSRLRGQVISHAGRPVSGADILRDAGATRIGVDPDYFNRWHFRFKFPPAAETWRRAYDPGGEKTISVSNVDAYGQLLFTSPEGPVPHCLYDHWAHFYDPATKYLKGQGSDVAVTFETDKGYHDEAGKIKIGVIQKEKWKVTVRVRDLDGQALEGASVLLGPASEGMTMRKSTGGDGTCVFEIPNEDLNDNNPYQTRAHWSGTRNEKEYEGTSADQQVNIQRDGQVIDLTIPVEVAMWTVLVRVKALSGELIPNATVTIGPENGPTLVTGQTDGLGVVVFKKRVKSGLSPYEIKAAKRSELKYGAGALAEKRETVDLERDGQLFELILPCSTQWAFSSRWSVSAGALLGGATQQFLLENTALKRIKKGYGERAYARNIIFVGAGFVAGASAPIPSVPIPPLSSPTPFVTTKPVTFEDFACFGEIRYGEIAFLGGIASGYAFFSSIDHRPKRDPRLPPLPTFPTHNGISISGPTMGGLGAGVLIMPGKWFLMG